MICANSKGSTCVLCLICAGLVILSTIPLAPWKLLPITKDQGANVAVDGSQGIEVFIVNSEEDAQSMAAAHATEKNELLFTTYSFSHHHQYNHDALYPALHVWENLRQIGRMNNSILITYDARTCQILWQHGLPCFLDRYMLQPSQLPGQYGSGNPHWYAKYAWASKFLQWGYHVTFFEADMAFIEDPLPHRNASYDLEGLSDWHTASLPVAKDRFTSPCNVYHMQKEENGGGNVLRFGPINQDDIRSQTHINPCMSTGFWFIEPTEPAKEFLAAFIDLMVNWRNTQTDQLLWNEVIMAFLIGQAGHRQLRFSLLDDTKFSNFEVVDWRKEQGLAIHPVMMHAGGISGKEKELYMRDHGLWLADKWKASSAMGHITNLLHTFNRTLPKADSPPE